MSITKHTKAIEFKQKINLNYLLYKPESGVKEEMPILLYLHGSGQCGNDLDMVKMHWPPAYCCNIPMLILAPQCSSDTPLWEVHNIKLLLDNIVEEFNADTTRIYITGMSMGAFGMWDMLIKYPKVFAAGISVCHGGYTNRSNLIKHIPLWLFHGAKDTLVDPGYSLRMAQSLLAEEDTKEVHLTLYPNADHDAWTPTYSNPEIYRWLLTHSLK